MSTVLPPDAGLLLLPPPLLRLLLPLLLQPAAAKGISAKAAIAVCRLMIFLPHIEIVRPPRSALTGLIQARGAAAAGDGRVTKSLTAAGPRFSPPWRILDRPAVDLLNSGWICQPLLGGAHRQAVIPRETRLGR